MQNLAKFISDNLKFQEQNFTEEIKRILSQCKLNKERA
jgi:hypothetical protein